MAEKTQRLDQLAGAKFMLPNRLINPGYRIWWRGGGPFTADDVFTSDEWKVKRHASDTLAVTQESTTVKHGSLSLKAVKTGVNDSSYIRQGLEDYRSYSGLYATFCAWVYTATASAVRVSIGDYVASEERANSAYHTGGGSWEQLIVTKLIRPSLVAYASYPHSFGAAAIIEIVPAATVYVDSAILVVADEAFPEGVSFAPLSLAEDTDRCHRFYNDASGINGYGYNPNAVTTDYAMITALSYPVEMYASPTVTLSSITTSRCGSVNHLGGQRNSYFRAKFVSGSAGRAHFSLNMKAEVT